MSFRTSRNTLALLLVALALSACAREGARPAVCLSHKVGNGELTECN